MAAPPLVAKNNFIENIADRIEDAIVSGPPLKVDSQNWALLVVLGPEGCAQRNVKFCEILLGVFDTEQEADDHVHKLWRRGYQWFDIHKVPMYKCLPLPPNTKVENVKYVDEEMNSIIGGYKKQEAFAQQALQERVAADREAERKRIAQLEADREAKHAEACEADRKAEACGADRESKHDEKK